MTCNADIKQFICYVWNNICTKIGSNIRDANEKYDSFIIYVSSKGFLDIIIALASSNTFVLGNYNCF